ncbi:MAG: tRNA lysidine(34) synthetase TilS [Chloroflexi bacterium]|nr:tRNA lysidine(34) synthetase TilS [Chloroflexota bacterium]
MLSQFGDFLRIGLKLNVERPILAGVSGGPDSLCLLDLLHRHGFSVVVAHLDHGLRPESGAEARGMRLVAENLGLPFVLEACDVASLAKAQGLSLEEAARTVRYRFLFRQAGVYGAQAVAVGHNADDQVETVLMHFLRGAGLTGLEGMAAISLPNPWSDTIPLARPLLSVWREEILEYCQQRGLKPLFDSSNLDTGLFRNRLRQELIPALDEYIPGVRQRLWRMADLLAEDNAVLEELAAAARKICLASKGTGYLAFDARVLRDQSVAAQRRLIRWAVSELRPNIRDLDYAAVERALSLLKPLTPLAHQRDIALGLRAFLENGLLYIAAWDANLPIAQWPQITADDVLQIPGVVNLLAGWSLKGEFVRDLESVREQALENADPFRAWIDAGEIGSTLTVRGRRPGDSFQPLGMGGESTKLSDVMINEKIPRRARARWPLICTGEQIVWLPGFRIAHPFRLRPTTRHAIFLELSLSE